MTTRKGGDAQRRQLLLEMYRDLCRVHRSFQVETVAQELLRSLHQHFRVDGAALVLLNAAGEEVLQCFLLGVRDAEAAKGQEPLWFGYDKRSHLNFLRDMLPRRLESPHGKEHKVGGAPLGVHWVVPMNLNYGISALLFVGATPETLGPDEFEMCEPISTRWVSLRTPTMCSASRTSPPRTIDGLQPAFLRDIPGRGSHPRAAIRESPVSDFPDLDGLRSVNIADPRKPHLQEVAARLLKNAFH